MGASGNLAPLAHLALPLIEKGRVFYKYKDVPIEDVFHAFGWEPIILQSKEGLALSNGNQFMSAYGIYLLFEILQILFSRFIRKYVFRFF